MSPPSLPSFQRCFRTLRGTGVWGWLHLQPVLCCLHPGVHGEENCNCCLCYCLDVFLMRCNADQLQHTPKQVYASPELVDHKPMGRYPFQYWNA